MTVFFRGRGAMPLQGRVLRVEPGVGFAMQFGEMTSETLYQLGQEIAQIGRQAASRREQDRQRSGSRRLALH